MSRGALALAAAALLACGPATGPGPVDDLVPDFHLADANPASARAGQDVSPRDYLGVVSGWYFGHSS